MPYRRRGNRVQHRKGGKWKTKQVCRSPKAAEAAIRLLRAKEHNPDWEPTGKRGMTVGHLLGAPRRKKRRRKRG